MTYYRPRHRVIDLNLQTIIIKANPRCLCWIFTKCHSALCPVTKNHTDKMLISDNLLEPCMKWLFFRIIVQMLLIKQQLLLLDAFMEQSQLTKSVTALLCFGSAYGQLSSVNSLMWFVASKNQWKLGFLQLDFYRKGCSLRKMCQAL